MPMHLRKKMLYLLVALLFLSVFSCQSIKQKVFSLLSYGTIYYAAPITASEKKHLSNPDSITAVWKSITLRGYPPHFLSQTNHGRIREINPDLDHCIMPQLAYDSLGMYVYMTVIDDDFGRGNRPEWWANDCVDFFIDTLPPETIFFHQKRLCEFNGNGITRSTIQFQASFKPSGIDSLHINKCSAPDSSGNVKILYQGYSIRDAETFTGVHVTSGIIDPLRRFQHWFIPWKLLYGKMRLPSRGSDLAVNFCYNDVDKGDSSCVQASAYGAGGLYQSGVRGWSTLKMSQGHIKGSLAVLESATSVARQIFPGRNFFSVVEFLPKKPDIVLAATAVRESLYYGEFWLGDSPVFFATSKMPDTLYRSFDPAKKEPDNFDLWTPKTFIIDRNTNLDLSDDAPGTWDLDSISSDTLVLNNAFFTFDSVKTHNGWAHYKFLWNKKYNKGIAAERLDVLKGSLTIDSKQYFTTVLFPVQIGFQPFFSDVWLGIDADHDGKINYSRGSYEMVFGVWDTIRTSAFTVKVRHVDIENNLFILDTVTSANNNCIELDQGENVLKILDIAHYQSVKKIRQWCESDSLVLLYCYFKNCGKSASMDLAEKSPQVQIKNILQKRFGKCVLVGVHNEKGKMESPAKDVYVMANGRNIKTNIFRLFNVTNFPELICIDYDGTILYRGEISGSDIADKAEIIAKQKIKNHQ